MSRAALRHAKVNHVDPVVCPDVSRISLKRAPRERRGVRYSPRQRYEAHMVLSAKFNRDR